MGVVVSCTGVHYNQTISCGELVDWSPQHGDFDENVDMWKYNEGLNHGG